SEAAQILQRLSGRTHEVCSAVAIYQQTLGKSAIFHESSRVRFRRLSDAMIRSYLAKVDTLDKAGAYAAQGSGAEIIAKIEGSFTNVVGLPMEKTVAELAKFGIRPESLRRTESTGKPRQRVRDYRTGVGSFLSANCDAPERNARSCFWRASGSNA